MKHAENWFEVVELDQSNTFTIIDQDFHDLLLSNSCGVLTHSLPFSEHTNSVFASYQLENNFTVFVCNNTHNLSPIESYFNYSFVNCSKVFYRKPLNNLEGDDGDHYEASSRFLNSYCKRVEVPIAENIAVDNRFAFLSENITIRVQLSPQCDTCHYVHGGQCQNSNGRFYCAKEKPRNVKFLVAVAVSAAGVVGILLVLGFCLRRHFYKKQNQTHLIIEQFLEAHGHLSAKRYSYLEVKKATNNFKNKLGQGAFGSVYKGRLSDGTLVAVKVLTGERILHLDIKPHNILLDDDFCPKISDFGLAKICPKNKDSIVSLLGTRGTAGYIAPEVFSRNFGGVSHKSDVYSYGMMMMEIVGGRKKMNLEVEGSSEIFMPHWIHQRLKSNLELRLDCIKNERDREFIKKIVIVSLWCIQIEPSNRPAMKKVVDMMEGGLELLELPPFPVLSLPPITSTSPSILEDLVSGNFYSVSLNS
ncbi:hypothetical protein K1719_008831 [Acacia pycnantha]|nr:hypothetical protein K1719_008831 [Acacia pycnantha]